MPRLAGGEAEAELGHPEQVKSLHQVAAQIVACRLERVQSRLLLGRGARSHDEDISAAQVRAEYDLGHIGLLDAGIGKLEADELAQLLTHRFSNTAGTEGVHESLEPIDSGGNQGGPKEAGRSGFGGFQNFGGVLA